ncbi:hypothetical protein [Arthrobacter sp. NPDC090010]|uniref:hypothetical protein n=1 Tax=Arthrobacter sp. NPDC090010 TaxID=3363942 RepID=UPI0037F72FCF
MDENSTRVPSWFWWLSGIVLAVAVVLATLLDFNARGARIDEMVGDPVLGFSKKQWGGLLSGVLGAVVGAVAAVGVLVATLSSQQKQFEQARKEQRLQFERAQDEQRLQFERAQEAAAKQRLDDRVFDAISDLTVAVASIKVGELIDDARIHELQTTFTHCSRIFLSGADQVKILAAIAADMMAVTTALFRVGISPQLNDADRDNINLRLSIIVAQLAGWDAAGPERKATALERISNASGSISDVLFRYGWKEGMAVKAAIDFADEQ